MIITGSRIATTSGAAAVGSHVLSGPANEAIDVLQGCQADLDDMVREARAAGSKYALRHWKVSPKEGMGTEDAWTVAADLAREFGADPSRMLIVEHQKLRAGSAGHDRHWHVIAPEYDPVAGRVLDAHWMRPRHEKLARIAEERLGHEHIPGRWNAAVARALKDEGRPELAARVEALAEQPRPESGYTAKQHQTLARHGHSLPADRIAVATAWRGSDGAQAFASALVEQGITVRQGDKPGTYITERDGVLIGAVHRLVGAKKDEVAARLNGADFQADSKPDKPAPLPPEAAHPVPSNLTPQVSDRGQPITSLTEQVSVPVQTAGSVAAVPQDAGSAASVDGGSCSSVGLSAEVIDGPGEPPGPCASIQEVQRYRERLFAYEEKKGHAAVRQQAALAAENERLSKKGATHAYVPAPAQAIPGTASALSILSTLVQVRPTVTARAQSWNSAHEQPPVRRDTGDEGQGPRSGQSFGVADGTTTRRAAEPNHGNPVRPDGSDGESAQDRGEGGQAIRRAAAQARLAHGLAALPHAMATLRRARLELDPAWRKRRDAHERIKADRARISEILSGHPHPDPLDLNAESRERTEERAARWEHTALRVADAVGTEAIAKAAFRDRGLLT